MLIIEERRGGFWIAVLSRLAVGIQQTELPIKMIEAT
jgi:hypothetical protein